MSVHITDRNTQTYIIATNSNINLQLAVIMFHTCAQLHHNIPQVSTLQGAIGCAIMPTWQLNNSDSSTWREQLNFHLYLNWETCCSRLQYVMTLTAEYWCILHSIMHHIILVCLLRFSNKLLHFPSINFSLNSILSQCCQRKKGFWSLNMEKPLVDLLKTFAHWHEHCYHCGSPSCMSAGCPVTIIV